MTSETAPAAVKSSAADEGMFLLVDKPAGWTSFDVVKKIRRIFHVKKAGHAGTLDPLATGLLIVCTGRRTKELARHTGADKEYDVTMRLGCRTASGDAETPVIETRPLEGITPERVAEVAGSFVGPQRQVPPMWSALKVNGKRLYEYAQEGVHVERAPRDVVIHSLAVREVAMPEASMTVVCSKGTYIRTLVDDIGTALGCGAYVTRLRRTRINTWSIDDASTIADLEQRARESVGPIL